jgi:hypothetical protein
MKGARTVIAVGLLAIGLTGCAATASPTIENDSSTLAFDDGLLTYKPRVVGDGRVGMTARYVGTLSFDDGCVLIDGSPYAFPQGATWDGDVLTIDGAEFATGDELTLGGGTVTGTPLPLEMPTSCTSNKLVLVSGLAT